MDILPNPSSCATVAFSDTIFALQSDDNEGILRSVVGHIAWDLVEIIKVGHRGRKELVISLDAAVWEKRAFLWIATLRLLDSLV